MPSNRPEKRRKYDLERMGRGFGNLVEVVDLPSTSLLVISWYALFLLTLQMTQTLLAPWSGAPLTNWPPLGTMERAANDFYAGPIGRVLPTVILVAASMAAFIYRSGTAHRLDRLCVGFAVANLVSLPLSYLLARVGGMVSNWVIPASSARFGYLHAALPALLVTGVFVALVMVQMRFPFDGTDNRSLHDYRRNQ